MMLDIDRSQEARDAKPHTIYFSMHVTSISLHTYRVSAAILISYATSRRLPPYARHDFLMFAAFSGACSPAHYADWLTLEISIFIHS